MDEQDMVKETAVQSYEAPRLTPIGNLRDILAGPGSLPCEGGLPAQASGGDADFMAPAQCGPPE